MRLLAAVLLGPLGTLRAAPRASILLVGLFFLLTALTQTGGLVLWFGHVPMRNLWRRLAPRSRFLAGMSAAALFLAAYLAVMLLAWPVAGLWGRVPLHCGLGGAADYGPRTLLTCLLNRHYATRAARQALEAVAVGHANRFPGARIAYLDAGFPFFAGFPMLPHLSHRDGRQVDLALAYQDGAGSPSPIGYWGYTPPRPGDPQPCADRPSRLRWDLDWLQPLLPVRPLDEARSADLLRRLSASTAVRRLFIEPHLAARLSPGLDGVGFQGCRAARHDDHIHVEFH